MPTAAVLFGIDGLLEPPVVHYSPFIIVLDHDGTARIELDHDGKTRVEIDYGP